MTARKTWMFGLAALGLTIATPIQASPDVFADPVWLVAKREADRETRRDARESRKDERRDIRRETEREGPEGYGYGYERRQQYRHDGDERRRDRR